MIKTWAMTGAAALALCATPTWGQTAEPAAGQPAGAPQDAPQVDDEPRAPGDVIVTAQRRSERLQDVPVAVSVVSGESILNTGAVNIENIANAIPTLNVRQSGTSLNQALYLRGIGTFGTPIAFEPSVSAVLDGVVLSRSGEAFTDLFDIERVEVLRGPQGTLFGKNASAGVINIVTKAPTDRFEGYVNADWFFGNGDEQRIQGVINVPLGERVRARVAGFAGRYDGNIINDTYNRRVNGYRHYGFRGVVEIDASEALKLTLRGDWRQARDNCCAEVIGSPARNADNTPFQAFLDRAALALPPVRGADTRRVRQNLITRTEEENWGLSLQGDLDIGDHVLTSITSYRKWDNREIRDGDFLDRIYVGIAQSHDDGPQRSDTFTQEVRLTSPGGGTFEYVVGGFYSRADSRRVFTRSNIACSSSTLPPIGAGLTPCSTAPGVSTITFPVGIADYGSVQTNYAAFGQGTLRVTDSFRLIAGLRFTRDVVTGDFIRTTPVPGASNPPFDAGVFNNGLGGGVPNGVPFRQRATASNLSGRAGFQFDLSPDSMFYGTYARGYKGPALNFFFNLNPNGTPIIDAELADSFEAGLKNSFLDGRVVLNIAAYYAKYRNFQANNPDFVLGQRVTRFTNAGDVSTRGIEIDLSARPIPDLNITGGLAYTDARVDDFRLPPGANPIDRVPNGTQLAYAPTWKGAFSFDYRVRTDGFVDVIFGSQASIQSSQISNFVGNNLIRANSTIPAYGLVDLWAALTPPDDRWQLRFQVRNVFDEAFAGQIQDGGPLSAGNTGSSSYRYIIPREADRYFGVTARVNF